MPAVLAECMSVLQSEAMFIILSNLTGLTLHPLAADNQQQPETDAGHAGVSGKEESDGSGETQMSTCTEDEASNLEHVDTAQSCKKPRLDNTDTCTEPPKLNADGENARCRGCIRRWQHGSYTLIHDTDNEAAELTLDAMLYCACEGWQAEYGGYTSYIARDEGEELLTVHPADNCLALVYRDKDTLRFVKHINNKVKELPSDRQHFYDFSLNYFE